MWKRAIRNVGGGGARDAPKQKGVTASVSTNKIFTIAELLT